MNILSRLAGPAILILQLMFSSMAARAQSSEYYISFKPGASRLEVKEFYIKGIVDARKSKTSMGTVVISKKSGIVNQEVKLQDNLAKALTNFLASSLDTRTKSRPVIVTIHELKLTETPQSGGLISGNFKIALSFATERNNELINLLDYNGGTKYTRSASNISVVEPAYSKSIIHAIQYFDTWINREAGTNELLAEKVTLSFRDNNSQRYKDTLFYDRNRPLSWSDFKGRPLQSSGFAAEIFPFFSFEESRKIANSVIRVDLNMKVYLVRSFSWVKDYARNSYTLNHEQRHFDLVKVAADRFKRKIGEQSLTADNYEGILSFEYLESLREMNKMQVQYDKETGHGTNQAAQEAWNFKIDKELKSINLLGLN